MKRIELIRHGPVINPEKRIYGWNDIPLSEPPEKILDVISKETINKTSIVITSDLQRCRTAADCLANFYNLPILITDQIREQSFGDWENMTWNEVKSDYPYEWQRFFEDWVHKRPPNGDSFMDVYQRVIRFLEKRRFYPNNEIWITHAGTIRAILTHVQNKSLFNVFDMDCAYYQSDTTYFD